MQNWNSVLMYIKAELGSKVNNFEITDDFLIQYFKENTMWEFSILEPLKAWTVIISEKNLLPSMGGIMYKLNTNSNNIIDVHDVYFTTTYDFLNEIRQYYWDTTDIVMSNTLNSMIKFLKTVNDFQFIRPDKILFAEKMKSKYCIVELNVTHDSPITIPTDLYHQLFKKMCLKDAIKMIMAERTKFQSVNTVFGEVNLNIDYLNNKIDKLEQEINDILEYLPPRDYIKII